MLISDPLLALPLALWAEEACSAGLYDPLDDGVTAHAGLALAAIHGELLRKVAGHTLAIGEIPKGRTACAYCLFQGLPHAACQESVALH